MKIFRFEKTQTLAISLDEAWEFFSNPNNLCKITPPELGLCVKGGAPSVIYNGMIIEYSVTPFPGLKSSWLTEIKHVKDKELFVDEQRSGPYKLWYHQHFFRSVKEGVEVRDVIHYALPCWIFSSIVNSLLVSRKLERIFNFRRDILSDFFK